MTITLTITVPEPDHDPVIAPAGLATPHLCPADFAVRGGRLALTAEAQTGQWVAVIRPEGGPVQLTTRFETRGLPYPESLFAHRPNRFTRAAGALAQGAQDVAARAGGGAAGLKAIVNDVCAQFTYGHPETRFYEGADEMPQLCGLTEGSCVDINAYLIAALRAAGYEAGYVTGYFFPAEKRSHCQDMHCWVVTRHGGQVQEWDIAHHLKMGLREIRPGLNPKPGVRVPMFHSMGLDLPDLGISEMKLLAQPMALGENGPVWPEVEIALEGYEELEAQGRR
jgi:hypothetical protein